MKIFGAASIALSLLAFCSSPAVASYVRRLDSALEDDAQSTVVDIAEDMMNVSGQKSKGGPGGKCSSKSSSSSSSKSGKVYSGQYSHVEDMVSRVLRTWTAASCLVSSMIFKIEVQQQPFILSFLYSFPQLTNPCYISTYLAGIYK